MIEITIKSKKYGDRLVKLSKEDYELVIPYRWALWKMGNHFYATSSHYGYSVKMHRLILGVNNSKIIVDHINGNGLDNRRENLRVANKQQNGRNAQKRKNCSSQFKGVYFDKRSEKWVSQIHIGEGQKKLFLGYFNNEIDAAISYDLAASEHFKGFARLNFPI